MAMPVSFRFQSNNSSSSVLGNKICRIAICFFIVVAFSDQEIQGVSLLSNDGTNLETLELVQVLFRHGDRTPTGTYPLDPYKNVSQFWPQGLGQLTDVGKLQHYNLGRYFRKRYDGFLNETYVPHEIFVLSSDMDRTIMSAEANLAGLYQPTNSDDDLVLPIDWTPIPIRTIPRMEDKFLRATKHCSKYQQIFKETMESEPIKRFNHNHREFIEYIKNNTGLNGDSFEDIVAVEDILTVETHHHLLLPSWAAKILNKFHQFAVKTFLWNTLTSEMKRLKGGPLLKMLLHNMRVHNKTSAKSLDADLESQFLIGKANKFYMFSAHDSTLMRLMDTIGVFNQIMVPYASALLIELHRNELHNKGFIVKMFFHNETNNAPYELEVPGCGKVCTLHKFIEILKPVTPENWETECNVDYFKTNLGSGIKWYKSDKDSKAQPDERSPQFVLAEAFLLVGVLLIIISVILFLARDKLSYPVVSHSYPYIKSKKNNYGYGISGLGYESI